MNFFERLHRKNQGKQITSARLDLIKAFQKDGAEHLAMLDLQRPCRVESKLFTDGKRSSVTVPAILLEHAKASTCDGWITHNHPRGFALSTQDLMLLGHGRINYVEAISADFCWFVASRGKRFDLAVLTKSRLALYDFLTVNPQFIDAISALGDAEQHVLCLALGTKLLINYEFHLSKARHDAYSLYAKR
jgi:hypothetical protein